MSNVKTRLTGSSEQWQQEGQQSQEERPAGMGWDRAGRAGEEGEEKRRVCVFSLKKAAAGKKKALFPLRFSPSAAICVGGSQKKKEGWPTPFSFNGRGSWQLMGGEKQKKGEAAKTTSLRPAPHGRKKEP